MVFISVNSGKILFHSFMMIDLSLRQLKIELCSTSLCRQGMILPKTQFDGMYENVTLW